MIRKGVTVWLSCFAMMLAAGQAFADAEEDFYRGIQSYRARNYVEAADWLRKSAEQGDSEAQFLLGRMNYDGNSLPQNYVEAYKWFQIAADGGVPVAERYRDGLSKSMTADEIAQARKLASEWWVQHPRKAGGQP